MAHSNNTTRIKHRTFAQTQRLDDMDEVDVKRGFKRQDMKLHMKRDYEIGRPTDTDGIVLESWAQGFMVGSLVIMAAITVANMRRRVLLHKLILMELVLGMAHGTFMFSSEPAYGWHLSSTAIGLNMSWSLHNVIAWMKNKPFLSRKVSLFYIGTVILAQPYWVLEIYANFTYFNNVNKIFEKTRPLEPLFRDPWWIYTTCNLFWVIKSQYDFGIIEIVRHSPRFGIMLGAMCLSVAFIIIDILSVIHVFKGALPIGINPFWKLSFVFKCLCDTVILDDFKTALDRLRDYWLGKFVPMGELRTSQSLRTGGPSFPTSRSRTFQDPVGILQPPPTKKPGWEFHNHREHEHTESTGLQPNGYNSRPSDEGLV